MTGIIAMYVRLLIWKWEYVNSAYDCLHAIDRATHNSPWPFKPKWRKDFSVLSSVAVINTNI